MSTVKAISPADAQEISDGGKGVLIDIRTVSEAVSEQLPGSLFLPFDLLSKARLGDLGIKNKMPIIVCRSGVRAKQAAQSLSREMGEVAVLEGGIDQWKKEGLKVDEGRKALPLERQVLAGAGGMMFLFTLLGLLVSPLFFGVTIFMALGMTFAGVSGSCLMGMILVKMPWNQQPLCGAECGVEQR